MATETRVGERSGDFAGFVTRNLDRSFRFAVLALADVVHAQDVVHDALLAAWQVGASWPVSSLDAVFGRRLVGQLRTALREQAQPANDAGPERVATALRLIDPDEQLVLAERFGMKGAIDPVANTLRGRGSLDRRVPPILTRLARLEAIVGAASAREATAHASGQAALAAHAPQPVAPRPDSEVARDLAALYASRDPGDAPAQLRWRLERSVREAEQATFEQAEIAESAGWGFAFKTILVVLVLTLAIGIASVAQLQRERNAVPDQASGPASPLTIAGVSVVNGSVEGGTVHVAATASSLVASFQASASWHVGARECRPDVLGVVDGTGQAQWLGQIGAHVDSLAGDSGSAQVFMTGPGPYCDAASYSSADGGRTWSTLTTLPPSTPADWLGFDPTSPQHLLLAAGSALERSPDGGRTWNQQALRGRPIGFDANGRLVAWEDGRFIDSHDEGATWVELEPGPAQQPLRGTALPGGVLAVLPDGLWWYPTGGEPSQVASGSILAVASLRDGAVVVGAESDGRPWLATVTDGRLTTAALPPELAARRVDAAEIALNDGGAVVALSGPVSAIAFASFVN